MKLVMKDLHIRCGGSGKNRQLAASVRCTRVLLWAAALSVACVLSAAAQAQPVSHRIEGRVALGSVSVREDLLVPYAFTGPNLRLEAAYGLTIDRHATEVLLGLGAAPTWTRDGDQGLVLQHELSGSYLYEWLKRPTRTLWAAGAIRFAHELDFPEAWDNAHSYWLDVLLVGPTTRYTEQLWQRGALELRADVGLVGMASRPPSRRLNKQDAMTKAHFHVDRLSSNPQLTWFGETACMQIDALLRLRRASERIGTGFGIGPQTRFSRATWPEPYTSWYTGILASYGWSLP